MKFLITWRTHSEKRHEVFKAFVAMPKDDPRAGGPPGVKLLGRWHDIAQCAGVAICESDDAHALLSWALQWNSTLDITVTPVVDDDEARAIARQTLA